jgi:hypothetical protein
MKQADFDALLVRTDILGYCRGVRTICKNMLYMVQSLEQSCKDIERPYVKGRPEPTEAQKQAAKEGEDGQA